MLEDSFLRAARWQKKAAEHKRDSTAQVARAERLARVDQLQFGSGHADALQKARIPHGGAFLR